MRVENDDGVVIELFELLGPDPVEGRDQRDLLAVVDPSALSLRQHDRRDVRQQTRADYLTHGQFHPFGANTEFFTSQ